MIPIHGHSIAGRNWLKVVARVLFDGPRLIARGLIGAYRLTLSPFVGFDCRHLPTCSQYAEEAIGHFGLWAGAWMTLARLSRCQPFGTSGLDFVPPALPAHSRWYLPWRYGLWRGTNKDLVMTTSMAGKVDNDGSGE
jgi:uncharacterized protein